jgi:hypothetical protein
VEVEVAQEVVLAAAPVVLEALVVLALVVLGGRRSSQ